MDELYYKFVDTTQRFDKKCIATNIQVTIRLLNIPNVQDKDMHKILEMLLMFPDPLTFLDGINASMYWKNIIIRQLLPTLRYSKNNKNVKEDHIILIQPENKACIRCKVNNITLMHKNHTVFCLPCYKMFAIKANNVLLDVGKLKFNMWYHKIYLFALCNDLVDDIKKCISIMYINFVRGEINA